MYISSEGTIQLPLLPEPRGVGFTLGFVTRWVTEHFATTLEHIDMACSCSSSPAHSWNLRKNGN